MNAADIRRELGFDLENGRQAYDLSEQTSIVTTAYFCKPGMTVMGVKNCFDRLLRIEVKDGEVINVRFADVC